MSQPQEISFDEFVVGLVCNGVVVVDACAIVELVVVQKEDVGILVHQEFKYMRRTVFRFKKKKKKRLVS